MKSVTADAPPPGSENDLTTPPDLEPPADDGAGAAQAPDQGGASASAAAAAAASDFGTRPLPFVPTPGAELADDVVSHRRVSASRRLAR